MLPIEDPGVGRITLRAIHHEVESADSVVIIVHGIGGTADSGYSAMRMSLRGADGTGDDIYHAGPTDETRASTSRSSQQKEDRIVLRGAQWRGTSDL